MLIVIINTITATIIINHWQGTVTTQISSSAKS